MNAENLLRQPIITEHGVFSANGGCTPPLGNDYTPYIGDLVPNQPWQPLTNTTWVITPSKSAREQVQEEILLKVKAAVEAEDLEKARELLELASKLKEL
jgi:hypothetical protein